MAPPSRSRQQNMSTSSNVTDTRDERNIDEDAQLLFSFLFFSLIVLYIVSPFDAIPEAHYGILGLVDDLFAAVFLFYLIWILANATTSIITTMVLVFLIYAQFAPKQK
jgi:uncharacterized membrane protein YkvA (DUF1232 family)